MTTHIAVVGGGPGGLFTSYIINQRLPDAEVTIFEASEVVGGKINTDTFSDGTPFEAGVAELYEYLGPGKDPLRTLIEKDLGLDTVDISGGTVLMDNTVIRDLDELEKEHGYDTRKRVEAFYTKIADLMPLEKYAHRWQPDNDHPWAKDTFRKCIENELGNDEAAKKYVEVAIHTDLATESWTCNGLNGIKNALMDNDEYMQVYHVIDGISKVPDELSKKIKANVRTSTRVTGIGKRGKKYTVSSLAIGEDSLSEQADEFDAVIVALPNHWLRTIKWDGKLAEAIHGVCAHYDLPAHYLRVSMLFSRKWWEGLEISGEFWMMDMFNGTCCYDESTRWDKYTGEEVESRWTRDDEGHDFDDEPNPIDGNEASLSNENRDSKGRFAISANALKASKAAHEATRDTDHDDPLEFSKIAVERAVRANDESGDLWYRASNHHYSYAMHLSAEMEHTRAKSTHDPNDADLVEAHTKAAKLQKIASTKHLKAYNVLMKQHEANIPLSISDQQGHVLSFLIAGGDALLMCSANQDDEDIIDYVLQSLPPVMRQNAEDNLVEAQVDRYVGSINAQPGGWPAEELRGEHTPEPKDHPGVFLCGDYFFDSTLNAALMSAGTAVELLLEYLGIEGEPGTEAIQALETNKVDV